jgi:hypothetical protein
LMDFLMDCLMDLNGFQMIVAPWRGKANGSHHPQIVRPWFLAYTSEGQWDGNKRYMMIHWWYMYIIYVYYITVIYRNVVHWCSLEILQKVPLEFTLYTVHPIFGQWQRHHQAAEWPKAVMMIQALASKRGGTNPLGWSTHGWQLVWVGGGPMDLCLWYRIFRHEHPFTRYYVDFEPIATWLHP